jgi:hypothetical protein
MAIKDMQTLLDEGHIAGPLDGSELLLIEQGGFSKVLTVDALYQYLSGRCGCSGSGDCTPTTVSITGLPEDATGVTDADVLTATYSYAGGPEITVTFAGASQKSGLLRELATAINSDSGLYLIDDELGTAPYSIGYFNRHDIAGGDGSVSAAPADLVLSLTTGAEYDAVAILFGAAVTVHSCGPKNWSGI